MTAVSMPACLGSFRRLNFEKESFTDKRPRSEDIACIAGYGFCVYLKGRLYGI